MRVNETSVLAHFICLVYIVILIRSVTSVGISFYFK
nr:MAG TPA: hypothetical protein [Caudoviricetes sp.]